MSKVSKILNRYNIKPSTRSGRFVFGLDYALEEKKLPPISDMVAEARYKGYRYDRTSKSWVKKYYTEHDLFKISKTASKIKFHNIVKRKDGLESIDHHYKANDILVYSKQDLKDIKRIIRKVGNPTDGRKVKVWFKHAGGVYGTPYLSTIDEAIEKIEEMLIKNQSYYDSNPFLITDLYITYGRFNVDLAGQGARAKTIDEMNKKWIIISDQSKSNCAYMAVVRARKRITDIKHNVSNAGKKLKQKINPDNKSWSTIDEIQKIANHIKLTIIVYDNLGKIIWTVKPEKEHNTYGHKNRVRDTIIELQLSDNHFSCLIRRNQQELAEYLERTALRNSKTNISKPLEETEYDSGVIPRMETSFKDSKKDTKYGTWDIETYKYNGEAYPYAVGLCWRKNKDEPLHTKQWWGADCMKAFVDFLINKENKMTGITLYAHNGGKFDNNLLLKQVLPRKDIRVRNSTELNSRWLNLKFQSSHNVNLTFRDSYTLIPESLDRATKAFQVEHQKLKETIDHDDITKDNYYTPEFKDKIKTYLDHDVLGLFEVIEKLSDLIWEKTVRTWKYNGKEFTKGVNITSSFTSASMAKKLFFYHYYNPKKYPIHTLSKELDKYIRLSYQGGRVEAFRMGMSDKPLFYYDFTSLYPSQMIHNLPYGAPKHMLGSDINLEGEFDECGDCIKEPFFGFIRCTVKQKRFDLKPLHGVKTKNGLVFPVIKKEKELTLFSEEIKTGLDYDMYEYKFIDGYHFSSGKFMKKFIEDTYQIKKNAEADGNKVLRQIAKIIINSSYGFWAIKTENVEGCEIISKDRILSPVYQQMWEDGKMISMGAIGDNYVVRSVGDMVGSTEVYKNVAIASAITSYARMRLWNLMIDVEASGGTIWYCDTDSIICDYRLEDDEELMAEYCPDGTGKELGSLKNEGGDYDTDRFYRGFVGGKKMYALQPHEDDPENVKVSCKGFTFKDKDGKKYINGKPLTIETFAKGFSDDDQLRINCGRADFCSEQNPFQVRIFKAKKEIKMFNYKAGSYDQESQIVHPLEDV